MGGRVTDGDGDGVGLAVSGAEAGELRLGDGLGDAVGEATSAGAAVAEPVAVPARGQAATSARATTAPTASSGGEGDEQRSVSRRASCGHYRGSRSARIAGLAVGRLGAVDSVFAGDDGRGTPVRSGPACGARRR